MTFVILLIVGLFFFHAISGFLDDESEDEDIGTDRISGYDMINSIIVNNSCFKNHTCGLYSLERVLFNESGESVAYVRINGQYIRRATIELENGTIDSFEMKGSLERLYKMADSVNGSVRSVHSRITGGELYVVTIDTPNGTLKSIDKNSRTSNNFI